MPSSSTRSTLLERTLLYYFRTVIVRLHSHGGMEAEFDFYVYQFSILLDMPVAQLVDKVLPDYTEGADWIAWEADQNWIRMLQQEANGQDPSVTVGQVAQDLICRRGIVAGRQRRGSVGLVPMGCGIGRHEKQHPWRVRSRDSMTALTSSDAHDPLFTRRRQCLETLFAFCWC